MEDYYGDLNILRNQALEQAAAEVVPLGIVDPVFPKSYLHKINKSGLVLIKFTKVLRFPKDMLDEYFRPDKQNSTIDDASGEEATETGDARGRRRLKTE